MPKIKQVLEEKSILQKDLAENVGISEEEISKIVRGKILPTVKKLEALCSKLEVKPLDLYEQKEIDLLAVGKSNEPLEPQNYRFSVRLPREWCEVLLDENKLKKCGYRDKTHWARVCLGRLTKQYEAIEKWEASAKLPVNTSFPLGVSSIPRAGKEKGE